MDTASEKQSKISIVWISLGVSVVLLLFLAIFILQNSQQVNITYLGAHGHLSFGVALLLAAVTGALLTVLVGSARLLQLRVQRHRQTSATATTSLPQ